MNISKHFIKSFYLIIAVMVSSCSKCNKPQVDTKEGQEISLNIGNEPATIDSRKARLLSDFNIIRALNEGLFRINKEGITSEAIAKSYSLSEDNKTYEIELKETFWSNDDPLTAHDFIYAWKSALNKNFAAPSASFLFPIKNAQAIKKGLLPASMLGAHADGDYKIVIELETPIPFFKELLSHTIYFPINQAVEKENPQWIITTENYVCNGPFKMVSWKHQNEIIAKKNDRYWDKEQVKLNKLTMIMVDEDTAFNLYQNKELHIVGSPFSNIPSDAIAHLNADDSLKKNAFLSTFWIRTNTQIYPLQDKNFRKSLSSSINRKDLVEHILNNNAEIATGIVPASMGLQASPLFKDGDSQEALKWLELSLKAMAISKKNLPELTLTYVGNSRNNKILAAIQDQWKKTLGLSVRLEPLEYKVYVDRISKGDYQLAWSSWTADFNDPINFLDVFKTKSIGTNNTGWESLDYISAIESSYENNNQENRKRSLADAEKFLIEDMPVIPVYHMSMLHMQDEQLKDLVLTKTGNIDFKWAYLSK